MIKPTTISHVTSEWEDQCAWLDARIEEQSARDYADSAEDRFWHMAKSYEKGKDNG